MGIHEGVYSRLAKPPKTDATYTLHIHNIQTLVRSTYTDIDLPALHHLHGSCELACNDI